MLQVHEPGLGCVVPLARRDVGVALDLVGYGVGGADVVEVVDDLWTWGVEGRPGVVGGEGKGVEYRWAVLRSIRVRCRSLVWPRRHGVRLLRMIGCGNGNLHIARATRVSIDPPRPSSPGLAVEDAELVEAELFLQAAAEGDAALARADDHDGDVGDGIVAVAVETADLVGELLYGSVFDDVRRGGSRVSSRYCTFDVQDAWASCCEEDMVFLGNGNVMARPPDAVQQ